MFPGFSPNISAKAGDNFRGHTRWLKPTAILGRKAGPHVDHANKIFESSLEFLGRKGKVPRRAAETRRREKLENRVKTLGTQLFHLFTLSLCILLLFHFSSLDALFYCMSATSMIAVGE